MTGMDNFGGERNFELDSEQLSMSNASESQMSSSSRSKSQGGFSETSKKSRRVENSKKKMRKKRVVKEGSPFEEEYLIELLQEDTKCTEDDKATVKNLMKVLTYFGLVEESIQLHSLVEKLI
jgi:intergrase/recombinase